MNTGIVKTIIYTKIFQICFGSSAIFTEIFTVFRA